MDMKKNLEDVQASLQKLGEDYPRLQSPFSILKRHAEEEDGALSSKTKRLIALALAVADGCQWCIAVHTQACLDAGSTKDEMIEACYVAVLMAGGPALMHIQLVLKAIEDLK